MKWFALLLVVGCASTPPSHVVRVAPRPRGAHVLAATGVPPQVAVDISSRQAAAAATPGAISLQNVLGTLKQVDDQGNASSISGGLSPIANNTVLCNVSGSTANPTACTSSNLVSGGLTQDPSAVAITGGTITGVYSALGLDWYMAGYAEIKALVPQITRCKQIPIGVMAGGASNSYSNTTVGEGGVVFGGANTVGTMSGNVFITPKTGKWGVRFRAVFAAPVTGHKGRLGIINYNHDHMVAVATNYDQDTTHLLIDILGVSENWTATSSVVSAGTPIDVTLTGDGTTITVKANGTTVGTTTNLTNLSNEPMQVAQLSTASYDAYPLDAMYCYVAP